MHASRHDIRAVRVVRAAANLGPFKRGESFQPAQLVCTQNSCTLPVCGNTDEGKKKNQTACLCSHTHMWDVWHLQWSTKKKKTHNDHSTLCNLKAPSWRARHWSYFWCHKWLFAYFLLDPRRRWKSLRSQLCAPEKTTCEISHFWNTRLAVCVLALLPTPSQSAKMETERVSLLVALKGEES